MRYFLLTCIIFFSLSGITHSAEIFGDAQVIDGDTIKIWHQEIRLDGIDAPETGQTCQLKDKKKNQTAWQCGVAAADALKKLVSQNKVMCSGEAKDKYGRLIATCYVENININETMVASGMAVAYRQFSDLYVLAEENAKAKRLGIWNTSFDMPDEFRASVWANASGKLSEACAIKGNINAKGEKIYHAPWSKHYKRTQINVNKGERWFCNEDEAKRAGWRPPYQ